MSEKSLEHARARLAAMRAAGIKPEFLDPIAKSGAHPSSLRLAINAKCWDCCGAGADGIAFTKTTIHLCTARETCSLWNHRPYQDHKFGLSSPPVSQEANTADDDGPRQWGSGGSVAKTPENAPAMAETP